MLRKHRSGRNLYHIILTFYTGIAARLRLETGHIFAVPIPEEYEAVGAELQQAVEQALAEAEQQDVHKSGNAVTPWLLKRVEELTAGKSLESSEYDFLTPPDDPDFVYQILLSSKILPELVSKVEATSTYSD